MKTKPSSSAFRKAFFLFLLCTAFAISCSKDNTNEVLPEVLPEVISIEPLTGILTSTVTVTGKNFSTSIAENEVTFNGKPAIITAATETELVVQVPPAADSGPVLVTTKGKTAVNQPEFTYQWVVTTIAGSTEGYVDGKGSEAKFYSPSGIAVDEQGNMFITDFGNCLIRKISSDGTVSTFAGSIPGYKDGSATIAQFYQPNGAVVDDQGNVFVSEEGSHTIRKIAADGVVSTLAGMAWSTTAPVDGNFSQATFMLPSGIAADVDGNLIIADQGSHRIRKMNLSSEMVSTIAGSEQGYLDGIALLAQFYRPVGVVSDDKDNVYVGDLFNHRIRKISSSGEVTTIAGSSYGFSNGTGSAAKFAYPAGLALDKHGNLYVADTENHLIRKITAEGVVTTFAGSIQGTEMARYSRAVFFSQGN